jgi:hypothetical protein
VDVQEELEKVVRAVKEWEERWTKGQGEERKKRKKGIGKGKWT